MSAKNSSTLNLPSCRTGNGVFTLSTCLLRARNMVLAAIIRNATYSAAAFGA